MIKMRLSKIKLPKETKTISRRFKWEDDIKKAEAEWTEAIKKNSQGKK